MISEARHIIYIISPFVKYTAFNEVQYLMSNAIEKNKSLKIKILYGIKDKKKDGSFIDENQLRDSRRMISELMSKYPKNIFAKETNTHVKIVVCDDERFILGSLNFLSFQGKYQGKKEDELHHEVGILSEDKKFIQEIKDIYFDWWGLQVYGKWYQ